MNTETLKKRLSNRVVVCVDICSSTSIIGDLIWTDNIQAWSKLLTAFKNDLKFYEGHYGYKLYKFVGDGWFLIFDTDAELSYLPDLLQGMCQHYTVLHEKYIDGLLNKKLNHIGLTIGCDIGTLFRLEQDGQDEFIGVPLNMAARLQGLGPSLKYRKIHNRAYFSRNLFTQLDASLFESFVVEDKEVTLRNVSGNEKLRVKSIKIPVEYDYY